MLTLKALAHHGLMGFLLEPHVEFLLPSGGSFAGRR
jgi:hypothetical protein